MPRPAWVFGRTIVELALLSLKVKPSYNSTKASPRRRPRAHGKSWKDNP